MFVHLHAAIARFLLLRGKEVTAHENDFLCVEELPGCCSSRSFSSGRVALQQRPVTPLQFQMELSRNLDRSTATMQISGGGVGGGGSAEQNSCTLSGRLAIQPASEQKKSQGGKACGAYRGCMADPDFIGRLRLHSFKDVP